MKKIEFFSLALLRYESMLSFFFRFKSIPREFNKISGENVPTPQSRGYNSDLKESRSVTVTTVTSLYLVLCQLDGGHQNVQVYPGSAITR